ncbi:MAG: AAA family ATPase [candidate division Zixibacteria bacterium]|nr:AAA family ATPase [candidate division Zixibacteria bacterium]
MTTHIEQENPALVIIDPLVAYIGAGVDIHRANETRAIMAKLADMADNHRVAILAIRHLTKGGKLKAIYRGIGSIDLTAACRSVLMVGFDPDNPQDRGIVQIKSNLAPMGEAIGYQLRDSSFFWTGESDLTCERMLSAEDSGSKSALSEAVDFLKSELADGPRETSQIWKDAIDADLAKATVKRAKSQIGIITRRQGEAGKKGGGKFIWQLPKDDLGDQAAHNKEFDTLNNPDIKHDRFPKPKDHHDFDPQMRVSSMCRKSCGNCQKL